MNRIDKKFKELKKLKKKAFIAYITAGDPSLYQTERLVCALVKARVDIIELGVPFSDPMADGPTIQRASERSLKKKTNIGSIIKLVKSIRKKSQVPLILMSYYNPIYRYGIDKFVKDTKEAGVDGAIIPDLPPEEAAPFLKPAKRSDYSCVFLLAPTSTAKRIKLVAGKKSPFIYYVSLTGVTGARESLPKQVTFDVRKIKRAAGRKPVCVGFGVSNEKQVKEISKVADGVIVGSAIVKIVEKNLSQPDIPKKIYNFTSRLVRALKGEH